MWFEPANNDDKNIWWFLKHIDWLKISWVKNSGLYDVAWQGLCMYHNHPQHTNVPMGWWDGMHMFFFFRAHLDIKLLGEPRTMRNTQLACHPFAKMDNFPVWWFCRWIRDWTWSLLKLRLDIDFLIQLLGFRCIWVTSPGWLETITNWPCNFFRSYPNVAGFQCPIVSPCLFDFLDIISWYQ